MHKRKEAETMGGGICRILRTIVGAIVLLGFLWFLSFGILFNQPTTKMTTITASQARHVHQYVGLNYVSKRRVPNGPDPIHNRGAGKSSQPPG
ncbi:hypothetical protein LguiA_017132 [Lonicera macranthoides]